MNSCSTHAAHTTRGLAHSVVAPQQTRWTALCIRAALLTGRTAFKDVFFGDGFVVQAVQVDVVEWPHSAVPSVPEGHRIIITGVGPLRCLNAVLE